MPVLRYLNDRCGSIIEVRSSKSQSTGKVRIKISGRLLEFDGDLEACLCLTMCLSVGLQSLSDGSTSRHGAQLDTELPTGQRAPSQSRFVIIEISPAFAPTPTPHEEWSSKLLVTSGRAGLSAVYLYL